MTKKEENKVMLLPLVIAAVVFAVPLGLVMLGNYMQQENEIRELRLEIADREVKLGDNEDYINGWNDCISYLKYLRRPQNITQNPMVII